MNWAGVLFASDEKVVPLTWRDGALDVKGHFHREAVEGFRHSGSQDAPAVKCDEGMNEGISMSLKLRGPSLGLHNAGLQIACL